VLATVLLGRVEELAASRKEFGELREVRGIGSKRMAASDHVGIDKEILDPVLLKEALHSLSGPWNFALPNRGLPVVFRPIGTFRQPNTPGLIAEISFVGVNS